MSNLIEPTDGYETQKPFRQAVRIFCGSGNAADKEKEREIRRESRRNEETSKEIEARTMTINPRRNETCDSGRNFKIINHIHKNENDKK